MHTEKVREVLYYAQIGNQRATFRQKKNKNGKVRREPSSYF